MSRVIVSRRPRPRLYTILVGEGPWAEVDSHSDGMCGWVRFENLETGESMAFDWDVYSEKCRSQSEAREQAETWIASRGAAR